jgi:hypothetical protein
LLPGSPGKHRTVIESQEFSNAKQGLGLEPELLDDVIRGTIWFLCSMAEWGHRIGDTAVHAVPLDLPGATNAATIYYTYTDDEVTLRDIMVSDI